MAAAYLIVWRYPHVPFGTTWTEYAPMVLLICALVALLYRSRHAWQVVATLAAVGGSMWYLATLR